MGLLGDLKLAWELRVLLAAMRKEWAMLADGKPLVASWTVVGSGLRALGAVILILVGVLMKEYSWATLIDTLTTNLPAILALVSVISGSFIHDVGKRRMQGEIAASNRAIEKAVNGGTHA